jgi:hypothetical protein
MRAEIHVGMECCTAYAHISEYREQKAHAHVVQAEAGSHAG